MSRNIDFAEEFTPTPLGRFAADGPRSGEIFRERLLRPALENAQAAGEKLTIDFSKMVGVNPSFLEEAFGGLVRHPSPTTGVLLSAEQILATLEFYSKHVYFALYIEKIKQYIRNGRTQKNN